MTNPSTDPTSSGHAADAVGEPSAPAQSAAATPRDSGEGSAEDAAPLFPTMPNLPDMRRDAIEEAAETSPEARSRVDQMNTDEATGDRSLSRRPSDVS